MPSSLKETISHLEDQTWRALQKNGSKLLPFLSRDCVMQFPMGLKVSAITDPSLEDILLSDAFIPWLQYSLKDMTVTELGPEAALVTYKAEALRPSLEGENNVDFNALCASVWRLDARSQEWQLCFHQQTTFEVA